MAMKKGGLGRGLDSLFTDAGGEVATNSVVSISEIEPDPNQPRKVFTEESLLELSASISEFGVLQPIVIRPNPAGGYKIIAGERRWRATRLAGLTEIPVIVKDVSEAQAVEIALIENLQREDLDPIEEAEGYKNLMEQCGLTQEMAAKRISKSRSAVANSLRILTLPEDIIEYLRQGKLSLGHAKVILGLEKVEDRRELAEVVVENGLNVRQTEDICKKIKKSAKAEKPVIKQLVFPSEVALSLKDALGTEVAVQYKEGKGSLNIKFYNDDQLKEFANLLGEYKKEKKECLIKLNKIICTIQKCLHWLMTNLLLCILKHIKI